MKQKVVRSLLIVSAFLLLNQFKPVGAQAPNCDCVGTIKSWKFVYLPPDDLCGTHEYHYQAFVGSAPGCQSFCNSAVNGGALQACANDPCLDGLGPGSASYQGSVLYSGTPPYSTGMQGNVQCPL